MRYKVLIALIMCYLLFVPTARTIHPSWVLENNLTISPSDYEQEVIFFLNRLKDEIHYELVDCQPFYNNQYNECRLNNTADFIEHLTTRFSILCDLKLTTAILQRLLNHFEDNMTLGELKKAWLSELTYLSQNLSAEMEKNANLNRNAHLKLNKYKMRYVLSTSSFLSNIVSIEGHLNAEDVFFTRYENQIIQELKHWYQKEYDYKIDKSCNYVLKSDLEKNFERLFYSKDSINVHFKKSILTSIPSSKIIETSIVLNSINLQLKHLFDMYVSSDKINRAAFLALFPKAISEPSIFAWSLPQSLKNWINVESLEKHPDEHFQAYIKNIKTWFSYHKNTIKNFSNTLKEPNSYLLKRDAFGEHFTNNKDKAAKETLRIIWATLVGIDTPIETSLKNLEIIWMIPLKEDELRVTFDQLFEELGERNWLLFQRDFMSLMPTETIIHQAIETAQKK